MRIHRPCITVLLAGLLAGAGATARAQDGGDPETRGDPPRARRELRERPKDGDQDQGGKKQEKEGKKQGQEGKKQDPRRKHDGGDDGPGKDGKQKQEQEKPAAGHTPAYQALAEVEESYRKGRVELRRQRDVAQTAHDDDKATALTQQLADLEEQHNQQMAALNKQYSEEAVDAALKTLREEHAAQREQGVQGEGAREGPAAGGELDATAQEQLQEFKKDFNKKRKALQDEYRRSLQEAREKLEGGVESEKYEAVKADLEATYKKKVQALKDDFDKKKASLESTKPEGDAPAARQQGDEPAKGNDGKKEPPAAREKRERPDKGDGTRKDRPPRGQNGSNGKGDGKGDGDGDG